jgi:hypothetical protein
MAGDWKSPLQEREARLRGLKLLKNESAQADFAVFVGAISIASQIVLLWSETQYKACALSGQTEADKIPSHNRKEREIPTISNQKSAIPSHQQPTTSNQQLTRFPSD